MSELETFFDAVKMGDITTVASVLALTPALASARLATGETPVMSALYRGHHDVIAVLLDAGAEVDVFAAAATGRVEDLRRLVNAPGAVSSFAYDGWTPLHLAAFFGHIEAARILLDAGADVHVVSQNGLTNTPLHAATAGKHSEVALLLLDNGAGSDIIDAGGYTPLQIADQNQLEWVVERMIGTGK